VRNLWAVLFGGLIAFTGIDGHHIYIAPDMVTAVFRSPPGYHAGTMIETQGGNHIVKDSRREVVRRLEHPAAAPGDPLCKSPN
jgi:hypothetical protein